MKTDELHRWPQGERPGSYGTPGAWEILDLLDRRQLSAATLLEGLAAYSTRDLRGAYHLTRNLEELNRRAMLMEGTDAGRSRRISARNLLRRAFRQARLVEEAQVLARQREALAREILADPPEPRGYRIRSVVQVLRMAISELPLPIKARRLLEVRRVDLVTALDSLVGGDPSGQASPAGVRELEREGILQLLGWALDLLDTMDT